MSKLRMEYTHPDFQKDPRAYEKLEKYNKYMKRKEKQELRKNGFIQTVFGWWYLSFIPWRVMSKSVFNRASGLDNDCYVNLLDKQENRKYKTHTSLPLLLLAVDATIIYIMLLLYGMAAEIGNPSTFSAFLSLLPETLKRTDLDARTFILTTLLIFIGVYATGKIMGFFANLFFVENKSDGFAFLQSNYTTTEVGKLRMAEEKYKKERESVDKNELRRKYHEFAVYNEQMDALESR